MIDTSDKVKITHRNVKIWAVVHAVEDGFLYVRYKKNKKTKELRIAVEKVEAVKKNSINNSDCLKKILKIFLMKKQVFFRTLCVVSFFLFIFGVYTNYTCTKENQKRHYSGLFSAFFQSKEPVSIWAVSKLFILLKKINNYKMFCSEGFLENSERGGPRSRQNFWIGFEGIFFIFVEWFSFNSVYCNFELFSETVIFLKLFSKSAVSYKNHILYILCIT
jgi:hypothetical protein